MLARRAAVVSLSAALHVALIGLGLALVRSLPSPPLFIQLAERVDVVAGPAGEPAGGPGDGASGPRVAASRTAPPAVDQGRARTRGSAARPPAPPAASPAPSSPASSSEPPVPPSIPPPALPDATEAPGPVLAPAPVAPESPAPASPAQPAASSPATIGSRLPAGSTPSAAPGSGDGAPASGPGGPGSTGDAGAGAAGSQAAARAPDSGGVPPEYGPYLLAFRRQVLESLEYPLAARRQRAEGKVELEVVIEPTGRVAQVRVVSSSAQPVLDEAAVDAVRRLAPVPIPAHLPQRSLRIRVPLVFQLR